MFFFSLSQKMDKEEAVVVDSPEDEQTVVLYTPDDELESTWQKIVETVEIRERDLEQRAIEYYVKKITAFVKEEEIGYHYKKRHDSRELFKDAPLPHYSYLFQAEGNGSSLVFLEAMFRINTSLSASGRRLRYSHYDGYSRILFFFQKLK